MTNFTHAKSFNSCKESGHTPLGTALPMRKLRHWISIIILMVLTVGNSLAQFSGGAGTQADPYQIATVADLQQLATNVNGGTDYSGIYFRLTANLDLSGVCGSNVGGSKVS